MLDISCNKRSPLRMRESKSFKLHIKLMNKNYYLPICKERGDKNQRCLLFFS